MAISIGDVLDVSELRVVASVLHDGLVLKGYKYSNIKPRLSEMVEEVVNGERLVLGQVVSLITKGSGGVEVGRSPGVVVDVEQSLNVLGSVGPMYTFAYLTGDCGGVEDIKLLVDRNIADSVDTAVDKAGVVDLLKTGAFGKSEVIDILEALSLTHLYFLRGDGDMDSVF